MANSNAGMERLTAVARKHLTRLGNTNNKALYNVVIKELLHREILSAMHLLPLAKKIAFQGGTALRLCHGGNRYSEDLDFCRRSEKAEPFTQEDIELFKTNVIGKVEKAFNVETSIKSPSNGVEFNSSAKEIEVKRWVFGVHMRDSNNLARTHKIHIEIADVFALEARPTSITNPYSEEHSGRSFLMAVSTAKEIFSDKFLAFVGRPYIKPRDIWDIKYLKDLNYKWDPDLIKKKVEQYGSCEGSYVGALNKAIDRSSDLLSPEFEVKFEDEMRRFLHRDASKQWIDDKENMKGLLIDVADYIEHQAGFLHLQESPTHTPAPTQRSGR